ncbi:serine/threonine protein kinase, partial [Candidatus Hydrogenedentota bacterium]
MQTPSKIKKIGDYVLLKKLGSGGMGSVYLARQVSLDRHVAVKVLSPSLATDETSVQRFFREARIMATLKHPNIVEIFDISSDLGYHYFSMSYIEGESLAGFVKKNGVPPVFTAIDIVAKAASALAFAHERSVLHRDIKSANIMISDDSDPILMDFGLARMSGEGTLTATGTILGTPHYMSPEQALGKPADERSDIYSLGIVLYELLCGAVPFTADTPYGVLHQHVNTPPPDIRDERDEVPEILEAVLRKCLEKEPDDRFQKACELESAISSSEIHTSIENLVSVRRQAFRSKTRQEPT